MTEKIKAVAGRTDAEAVIVPLYVGGIVDVGDYFELVDYWIDGLLGAAEKKNLLNKS